MTSLVFVHGVNTRSTEAYRAEVAIRDQLFRDVALGGNGTIINSSWGDLVLTWRWSQASLPTPMDFEQDKAFALGPRQGPGAGTPSSRVAAFAARAPHEAIDELFVQLVETALLEKRSLTAAELGDFVAASAYLSKLDDGEPLPPFAAQSDELFAKELRAKLSGGDAGYGLVDPLKNLVKGFADRIGNAASGAVLDLVRGGLNERFGRFLGDVFTYLQDGGANREKIREEVTAKLRAGAAAGEKLVVVGHSMGGVILYDLLSDPKRPLGDLHIHLLVTVGSQVGVFEEMKLFSSSLPAYSAANQNRVPPLSSVSRWLNVYDPVDPLSFRCSGIFEGVEDFVFSSTTSLLDAHSAYFKRPRFFARLARRLQP